MRSYGYYLIRAKQELIAYLGTMYDSEFAAMMNEPVLWRRQEGGRTVWRRADYTASVKLLFILYLYDDYRTKAQNSKLQAVIDQVLGMPPFTLEVFDRWWTIEVFSYIDEDFENVVE